MKKSFNKQLTKVMAATIHNHFKDKGYEFLKPGPHLSGLLDIDENKIRQARMLEIQKGISEACGKPTTLLAEMTEAEIKKLGKDLVNAFNDIPRDVYDYIVENFYSQNNHMKRKHPKLLKLIQGLMRFVNEMDENKGLRNDEIDTDSLKKDKRKESKRAKKAGKNF